MSTQANPVNYDAKQIKLLQGLEPVRKRPGMYIGSTDSKGLHHLAKEIADNSVDEAIAGFGEKIQLIRKKPTKIHEELSPKGALGEEAIVVIDNGRGIPTEMHESGVSAMEVVMTKLHAGGKFEETAYQASGGLHGVGSSAVNAVSSAMQIISKRNGKYFYQTHSQGIPKSKVVEIKESKVKELFPTASKDFVNYKTGTIVCFVPDETIFSTTQFSQNILTQVLKDRAYLMAGLYFEFIDLIGDSHQHFYFEGGIRALVKHINMSRKPLHNVFHVDQFWTDEETGKKIGVEVALQYNDSFNQRIESYVNVIRTPDGGTHINGFRSALSKVLRDYAEKNELLKPKEKFNVDDLMEGLTAVIFVKMPANDLQFESQTKAKLNNAEAQSAVYYVVKEGLSTFLEENPKVGKTIVGKILLAARARMAARAAKDAVVRKGVLEGSSLPGKLADCQSRKAEEAEIYIVEGDSAGGCFSEKTKVALADGRHLSFKNLVAEAQKGKQNFCYTIRQNGKIGLEKIINPRLTKKNAQVIEVKLDNKEKIICTPDHKFMLRDGSYKEAQNLKPNDSLMPLYRKPSDINQPKITIDDYEMVWDPKSDSWLFTHLLGDWYNRWQKKYNKKDGDHCHHLDFNKQNNNPTNLTRLPAAKHLQLHRKQAHKTLHTPEAIEKSRKIRQSQKFRKKMSQRMRHPQTKAILSKQAQKQWANEDYKQFMLESWKNFYESNPEYQTQVKKQLNQAQKKYWHKKAHRQQQALRVKTYFEKNPAAKENLSQQAQMQWQDKALLEWRSQATKKQWTPEFRTQRRKTLRQTYYKKTISALNQSKNENGQIDLKLYRQHRLKTNDKSLLRFDTLVERYFAGNKAQALEVATHHNHKIVSIKKLNKKIDVYDLEVPHSHNFALASGVFVHNSAKQGRDRKFQAIFPLRGKILNTERARLDRVVAFEELKNLVIALGAGIGETFDIENLRYHRIILMNDADVDGEHITTLGLTFFFRHLPEIVKQGYLYVAMPPLYKLTAGKKEVYVYTEDEREARLTELKKEYSSTIKIQRYKGLGEMNPEQLWSTTMNPQSRILKKVTIADAQMADQTFSDLMGNDVMPRKKFIQKQAQFAEIDI